MPIRKSATATFKALKGKGEFEAEFSVFGNVDLDGDRIVKGAFAPAFEKNPTPAIVWTHSWDIPPIGATIEAVETETGAKGVGRLFVDEHEIAAQVWAGMKSDPPALTQYSFAFNIGDSQLVAAKAGEDTPRRDGQIREIKTVSDIFEWGPTLMGANPATSTLDLAKSIRLRQGAKMLGRKGYEDCDYWSLDALLGMLDDAFWFIYCEDDEDDIATMRGVAATLLTLLGKEATEDDSAKSRMADWLKSETATKYGARHSADDFNRIQMIHDLAIELGATSGEGAVVDDPNNDDPGGDPLIMSAPKPEAVAALFAERPFIF
jgi:hypothetical protein